MDYMRIVKHYEDCFERNGDNNKGVDWPNQADASKRYGIMLDVIRYDRLRGGSGTSSHILDFGCGLGHLFEFINNREEYKDYIYTGLDVSEKYIEYCKRKHPQEEWIKKDILLDDIDEKYDYIIANGVFTEKLDLTYNDMERYFFEMIGKLYELCTRAITFNVMSTHVDWTRKDLFHVSLDSIGGFLTRNVTRNFIIRNDYGLYEYTVYVFKNNIITDGIDNETEV